MNVTVYKLAPVLPTTIAAVQFPDVQKATEAVIDVMNKGVGIRMFPWNFFSKHRFISLPFSFL